MIRAEERIVGTNGKKEAGAQEPDSEVQKRLQSDLCEGENDQEGEKAAKADSERSPKLQRKVPTVLDKGRKLALEPIWI